MIDQPPSTRVGRVVSEARSLPAPGSENIWHQRDLGPQRRPDEALLLLGAAVADQRGQHPRRDLQVGAADPGLRQLGVDHQLLDRSGVEAPRHRPVRHEVAGVGQRGPPLGPVDGLRGRRRSSRARTRAGSASGGSSIDIVRTSPAATAAATRARAVAGAGSSDRSDVARLR